MAELAEAADSKSGLLLLKLCPTRVKFVHFFLGFFQFRVSAHQTCTVGGNGRISGTDPFRVQYQFGRGDALFNAGVFASLKVREFLFR